MVKLRFFIRETQSIISHRKTCITLGFKNLLSFGNWELFKRSLKVHRHDPDLFQKEERYSPQVPRSPLDDKEAAEVVMPPLLGSAVGREETGMDDAPKGVPR
jgi:hypothetical protein